jgi:hypothetical protein
MMTSSPASARSNNEESLAFVDLQVMVSTFRITVGYRPCGEMVNYYPFYLLAPGWAHYPMVAFATMATIIASQAVRGMHMNQALRCGARTRSGNPCQSPAVREKRRCRMHGI